VLTHQSLYSLRVASPDQAEYLGMVMLRLLREASM
jgi:hypothetical protein